MNSDDGFDIGKIKIINSDLTDYLKMSSNGLYCGLYLMV